jgi:molybdopterin molybdotransferase
MISVEDAQALIAKNIPPRKNEMAPLIAALGCVISEEIKSPYPIPIFDNSAMDGFAFAANDTKNASPEVPSRFVIRGTIKAGDSPIRSKPNEAWRIMTGAPIPRGADTVLEKEKATVAQDLLVIFEPFAKGRHVRYRGEELKKAQRVISKGTTVNAATIGILSSLGKKEARIYKKPNISVIATGSELVAPGSALLQGKIYDSNSPMVIAALMQMGIRPVLTKRLDDQPKKIKQVIGHALRESDLVILMGGVSAGDTDYVKPILQELGVQTIFWKVSQKPGKPTYFGKKEDTLVFGLPGNPAAVFTCFYEYVYPAIRGFMGFRDPYLGSKFFPVGESIEADPEKSLFLKAKIEATHGGPVVTALGCQSSHMISSLEEANGILVIPSKKSVEQGQKALVHLLPYGGTVSHES